MFGFRFFFAVVLAANHILSASAFQPGSDYNIYPTTNLHNCTRSTPTSNATVRNAFDSLPQIDPSSEDGWEQWTLYFLLGVFQFVLRWNKGNPSSSLVPSPAHFDVIANINGFPGETTMVGDLSYTNDGQVMQIAIGENTLTWDVDGLWFNASVNIDDYEIRLNSSSETLDSFHPNVAFYNGLLDESGAWFGSVPIVRGQVVGSFLTPTNQFVNLEGVSVMRHMFSQNPLPSYINQYTGGTIWGYSGNFYDSHIFYQTETTDGTVHQAAFLGRALPIPDGENGFSSAWATYAVTDDPLYNLSLDSDGIDASFSGCADTSNIPYLFNTTALALFGVFPDLGGGTTTYYTFNGTTSAPFDGVVTKGVVTGFYEEYVAPPLNV